MKVFLLINAFAFLLLSSSFAQSVPQGMKYQAVARDNSGQVLSNQKISLKISLLSEGNSNSYYSEIHDVTTNELGLFTLVVGGGKIDKGVFKNVPWSTEDIWMQVSIKDKANTTFSMISNSKLLAVPYAFHAATASQLVGSPISINSVASSAASDGVPSQNWSLFGNSKSNPLTDKLGTTDYADLVVVTNNLERLRILANGDIFIKRSLNIGANLNVDSSVNLNRVAGSTINNGPFTVGTLARRSPTFLFGSLTVDSAQATKLGGTLTVDRATQLNSSLTVNGPTDLNSRLNVNKKSPTTLTGTLNVKGITDLDSALNVNAKNPTVLTGTLRVDSNTVFNSPTNSDTSLASPNGAVAIYGGVGIAKNLTVGGDVRIGGKTTFAGPLRITDPTSSINDTTGAVTVKGGVGIHENLNVGGNTSIKGSATVAGVTTINNVLNVNAGAGQVSITGASGGGTDGNQGSYPLVVSGKSQGVMINITGTTQATSANNFVTFQDGSAIRGRIEGQTQAELENEERYKNDVLHMQIAIAAAIGSEIKDQATLVGALAATTPCVGIGVCETAPPLAPIVAATANALIDVAKVAEALDALDTYKATRHASLGVTYSSNGADYAEWLPKLNKQDHLMAGEVVGVKNGFISRSTKNAEKIMVISTNPIVLGNMGNAAGSEKVAFMGQVPVRVFGNVEIGDYIIATGDDNGFGIAKHPQDLTANDYQQLVGIAWSKSQNTTASVINVAVGLANGANKLMQKQDEKIASLSSELNDLKAQVNKTNELLAKLVSGNKNSIALSEIPVASTSVSNTSNNVVNTATTSSSIASVNSPIASLNSPVSTVNDPNGRWIYNPLTDSELEEGLKLAQQMLADKGVNVNEDPFFKKIKTDPSYKATFMGKFKENYNNNLERIKKADKVVVVK